MEKAYALSEKILKDVNTYSEKYTSEDGKSITTKESIADLNVIIEEGFSLHKYLVEKKLYEGKPAIESALIELQKYMEKLSINKENAEKLQLSSAMQLWNQAKIAIAMLACNILDFKDSLN
jgi:hypothetical protein